jgi:hypothetical protein
MATLGCLGPRLDAALAGLIGIIIFGPIDTPTIHGRFQEFVRVCWIERCERQCVRFSDVTLSRALRWPIEGVQTINYNYKILLPLSMGGVTE